MDMVRLPLITKNLSAADNHWERRSQCFPMKFHWVSQPHFKAGPMTRSSWPTQNKFTGIFVDLFSYFVLFGHLFCLVGLLLAYFCLFVWYVCVSWGGELALFKSFFPLKYLIHVLSK